MNRHEGVSCDSCLKSSFRGRRYKCLVCYDYDLCSACYEGGATDTRHNADHPMQCILTRTDCELYYGGETLTDFKQCQSYTCPYCGQQGFTNITLQEHVTSKHTNTTFEVVCPVCATTPGENRNLMTNDFAGHLMLHHGTGSQNLRLFLNEQVATRIHNVRRVPHSAHVLESGHGAQSVRPPRLNMHFGAFNAGTLSSLSPSSRDSADPIAEFFLSQLSGVRRSAANTNSGTSNQLRQLHMQLELERQQVNATHGQLERLPPHQTIREKTPIDSAGSHTLMAKPAVAVSQSATRSLPTPTLNSNFLLVSLLEELSFKHNTEDIRLDHSQFVQQLVLSTMLCRKE